MAKTITWKPKATLQLREIIQYLKTEFSENTAEKYIRIVRDSLEMLSKYPEIGHLTKFKTVRRRRISKHNSFYYRVSGRKIIILFIWDGRMDPGKNPYS